MPSTRIRRYLARPLLARLTSALQGRVMPREGRDGPERPPSLESSATGGLKISVGVDILDVIQVFQGLEQF